MGYVLFFKEQMIHKVFGNKPSNIQITSYPGRGVKRGCEKSLCVINETLYYASQEGFCAYDGSMPYLISNNIKKDYEKAVACQENGKYYVSILDNEWEVYVFDTNFKLWHREDRSRFKATCYADGKMYYVDAENALRLIKDSENGKECVFWYLESGDQEEGSLNKKRLHKLQFLMDLEKGSLVELYIKYDNDPVWERVKTFIAQDKQSFQLHLRPRRCTHYRWKLSGHGDMRLIGLSKEYEIGTGR